MVRGAGAAGADRRDGRDRARPRARDHAADRVDEPAHPVSGRTCACALHPRCRVELPGGHEGPSEPNMRCSRNSRA